MGRTPRELRWNVKSEPNPTTHHYTMLIINTRTQTDRIMQRVWQVLEPIEEPITLTEGKVQGDRYARYRLIEFDSYRNSATRIDWDRIYQGKVVQDRDLYPREKRDGLTIFVDKQMTPKR